MFYEAKELNVPNRYVAWVSIDFYRFGWVKEFGVMHIETTFDVKEAMSFTDNFAGHLKHTCDVNGAGCWIFSKAEVSKREEA